MLESTRVRLQTTIVNSGGFEINLDGDIYIKINFDTDPAPVTMMSGVVQSVM